MLIMLNESTVLRKSCDDCVEQPVKREVASTEENQEDISKSRETNHELPRETRTVKDHPKDQVMGDLKSVIA